MANLGSELSWVSMLKCWTLPSTAALPVGNRYDRVALSQAEGRSLLGHRLTGDQERQGEGMLRLAVTPAVLEYAVDDGWTLVRVWIGSLRWESEMGV